MTTDDLNEILKYLRRKGLSLDSMSAADLRQELNGFLAWNEALSLAIEERTGQDCPDGAEYTPEDFDRAQEILRLYPAHTEGA